MANKTASDALSVKGTNPQYLIEKIIRTRIYDDRYWKEECFGLSAELLVDKAMALTTVGGVHGASIKPTPFLCLLLKLLQIQPEKDIIIQFIRQEDFKYVRALGAMYMRLVGTSLDCYKYLEPLYNDYRKIRKQTSQSAFEIVHMDEFIEELLHEERVCGVILPRLQKRHILERNNELDPQISALNDDLEDQESDDERNIVPMKKVSSSKSTNAQSKHRCRSPFSRQHLLKESRGYGRGHRHHHSRSIDKKYKAYEKKCRPRARSSYDKDDHDKHSSHHYKHSHTHSYRE